MREATIKKATRGATGVVLGALLVLSAPACRNREKAVVDGRAASVEGSEPTGGEVANDGTAPNPNAALPLLSERRLRTGTQYIAAIAKTLGLPLADLNEAFDKVKTSLPASGDLSTKNVHDGLWTAVSSVASSGCRRYVDRLPDKDKASSTEQALASLAELLFLDPTVRDTAKAQAQTFVSALGQDKPATATHTACTLLVSTLIFF